MKPSYKGQRSVPATDQKFRIKDEHLIEKNKEEIDNMNHGDKTAPIPGHHPDKFEEVDRSSAKKK